MNRRLREIADERRKGDPEEQKQRQRASARGANEGGNTSKEVVIARKFYRSEGVDGHQRKRFCPRNKDDLSLSFFCSCY